MVTMVNEFEKVLGCTHKRIFQTNFQSPKEMLCRGLRCFIGDSAKWLQGYDSVCEWLNNNNRKGLLLYGSNGRGKTLLCYDIIPVLFQYYYPQTKLYKCRANELRELKPEKKDYYSFIIADVVFIDDFGTESISNNYGEKRDVFSDIVDIAEHERKLLVLSTNLSPSEIGTRYGLRTLDRLHAITKPICLEGESLRGK